MKLFSAFLIGLLPLALAKSILVTFPTGTPQKEIDDAKQSIVENGGTITHEFNLIKGFSAEASDNAVQILSTKSTKYKPTIESDEMVSIYGE